jgi:uncharacterized protein (TIGR03067 family)
MRGQVASLGCAFALVASALVGVAADDKADKDLKQFQGVWTIESREVGGKKEPAEKNKYVTGTFDGDKVVVKHGDKVLMKGTQKLNPSRTPKAVDVTITEGDGKGALMLGIYEIDGDTLKVCFDEEGKNRPTEFKTAEGSKTSLNVHKRVKK